MDTWGYMWIHGDTWGYMGICGYMWIHRDTCGYIGKHGDTCGYMQWGREGGRGGGGGAIAPGPGPVVGARAKLDFFCVDRKSVGDPGGDPGMITPPPLNLSRY